MNYSQLHLSSLSSVARLRSSSQRQMVNHRLEPQRLLEPLLLAAVLFLFRKSLWIEIPALLALWGTQLELCAKTSPSTPRFFLARRAFLTTAVFLPLLLKGWERLPPIYVSLSCGFSLMAILQFKKHIGYKPNR